MLHPEKRLVGRAVTALFLPRRPDVEEVIEAEAKTAGLGPGTTQRVIDFLRPGDVLVVDVMGRVEDATFGGDNLATAIYGITGNGYVINGAIRDTEGIHAHRRKRIESEAASLPHLGATRPNTGAAV